MNNTRTKRLTGNKLQQRLNRFSRRIMIADRLCCSKQEIDWRLKFSRTRLGRKESEIKSTLSHRRSRPRF